MAPSRHLRGVPLLRGLTLAAMVVVLALGSLLPRAAMPYVAADGSLVLVLCTGDGPVQMVLDPATGETRPVPQESPHGTCDWASAQPLWAEAQPLLLPDPLWQLATTLDLPPPASGAPAQQIIAPSARGPPSLA